MSEIPQQLLTLNIPPTPKLRRSTNSIKSSSQYSQQIPKLRIIDKFKTRDQLLLPLPLPLQQPPHIVITADMEDICRDAGHNRNGKSTNPKLTRALNKSGKGEKNENYYVCLLVIVLFHFYILTNNKRHPPPPTRRSTLFRSVMRQCTWRRSCRIMRGPGWRVGDYVETVPS